MPNWQELVRQRLSGLALNAAEKDEILAELAAHLEESYEVFRKQGLPEQEALQRTLAQVADWQDLQRKILIARRREQPMQKRVHQLWFPGLLTMTLSVIFLITLRKLGFQPRNVGSGPDGILFYAPWLASLTFVGALGAYLSARNGGLPRTMLLVSAFPALALTGAFLSMFPIGFVIERIIGRANGFGMLATELLRDGIDWILVPGVALLAGGFLVYLLFDRRAWSKETATG
jgi:hypothetical protein